MTDIARQEIRSYRQMPKNLYHIQTKFRDERRPRFGVMRGREFTMKDAYSFDRTPEAALVSYKAMYDAYVRIFERMGLEFRAVAADTGAIGGSASHEFQVIADTGEDAIAWCPESGYAANVEAVTTAVPPPLPLDGLPDPVVHDTGDTPTIASRALSRSSVTASTVYVSSGRRIAGRQFLLLRGPKATPATFSHAPFSLVAASWAASVCFTTSAWMARRRSE